ncbi:MAG: tRNA epoxyqueuosine(34) reductase QueG [Verrucomicrobiia bacterium]
MTSPEGSGKPTATAIRSELAARGFDAVGFAPCEPIPHSAYLRQWLAEGQAGDMTWMTRGLDTRLDPTGLLPQARTLIVAGLNSYQPHPPGRGLIARYALGSDYHSLLRHRLHEVATWLETFGGHQRVCVDTSPLMEKVIAARAGLGWQGKHTVLIHRRHGTWLLLGVIVTTLDIPPDPPAPDRCGSCQRCLQACPTRAITAPYQLDARRCLAYLSVEHQGPIPTPFRRPMGHRLFGCDDCLDVCPWNRWAQHTRETSLAARPLPDLRDMLNWDDATFRHHFRGTPIFRLKRPRWLRNLAVVLGNIGTPDDLPALHRAASDPHPLIAEHASWAISEILARSQTSPSAQPGPATNQPPPTETPPPS